MSFPNRRSALSTTVPAAICVPVRDEEEMLPALIAALAVQDVSGVDPVACFFLDGCTDRSEAILRSAARSFPYPLRIAPGPAHACPNAGRARQAATALGLDHAASAPRGILLSTDADSRPRPDWIAAAVHALARADFAAGVLVRAHGAHDPVQTRLELYYDRLHALRRAIDPVPWEMPVGRHFTGGANLAFRVAAYREVGGFRPIPCAEDATLLDEAARAGFRVRRDRAMIVETSSRRHGRAQGGLACALRELDTAGIPLVAHPHAAVWQYEAHAAARRAFAAIADPRARARFGEAIGLDGDHVLGVARDCPNAEAFAMRIVPAAPGGTDPVPLPAAEAALAMLEAKLCETAA